MIVNIITRLSRSVETRHTINFVPNRVLLVWVQHVKSATRISSASNLENRMGIATIPFQFLESMFNIVKLTFEKPSFPHTSEFDFIPHHIPFVSSFRPTLSFHVVRFDSTLLARVSIWATLMAVSLIWTMLGTTPSRCRASSFPQSNVSTYLSSTDFRLL